MQQPQLLEALGLYPNPFADQLNIGFRLRVAASVSVAIFDVAGEPVWRWQRPVPAGANAAPWLGVNERGSRCASGVYLIHVKAQGLDGTEGAYWARALLAR